MFYTFIGIFSLVGCGLCSVLYVASHSNAYTMLAAAFMILAQICNKKLTRQAIDKSVNS